MFNVDGHYNPHSIANVISFDKLAAIPGVWITTDTAVERSLIVTVNNSEFKFIPCNDGLYYINAQNILQSNETDNNNNTKNHINSYSNSAQSKCSNINVDVRNRKHYKKKVNVNLVSTVENNKVIYSPSQITKANAARKLQHELGWPVTQKLKELIKNNFLINCSVNVEDVNRALQIYGVPEPLLYGRMVAPKQVSQRSRTAPVPSEVYDIHKN